MALDAPMLPAGVPEFLDGQADAEPSLQVVTQQLADGRLTILDLVSSPPHSLAMQTGRMFSSAAFF